LALSIKLRAFFLRNGANLVEHLSPTFSHILFKPGLDQTESAVREFQQRAAGLFNESILDVRVRRV
jgi:hypothetical protein